jgi:hypothetical protein
VNQPGRRLLDGQIGGIESMHSRRDGPDRRSGERGATRAARAAVAMILVGLIAGSQGCAGGQGLGGILSGLVDLTGRGAGGAAAGPLGAGGGLGPGAPEATGGIPAPGGLGLPPSGNGQRTPPQSLPSGPVADLTNELATKHGITLRGSPTETDVRNVLISARQYRPEETRGLRISYTDSRRNSGVLGVWSNGNSEIYSSMLDVVFHEMTHHITLFRNNGRSRSIGQQTVAAAREAGSGRIPSNCITRSYAQSNTAEFMAEFFTGLAGLERGVPLRFTIRNGTYNPPESVRAAARQIYAAAQ